MYIYISDNAYKYLYFDFFFGFGVIILNVLDDIYKFFIIPMFGLGLAIPLISVIIIKSWKLLKTVHSNVYFLGLVSSIMQAGATIVHSSGLKVVSENLGLFTEEQFVVMKDISEAQSGLIRIFSGYVSDIIKDQKGFLILGYGAMIIFKIIFVLVAMLDVLQGYLPSSIFGFKTVLIFGIAYVVAHMLDRVFNGLRDAPRQKLINTTTTQENKFICFAIRKSIASIGTVIGAVITFYCMEYNMLDTAWPLWLTSTHKAYILSVLIVSAAVGLLIVKIRNINTNTSTQENKKSDVANSSYWVYTSATMVIIPLIVFLRNYLISFIATFKFVDFGGSAGVSFALVAMSVVFFRYTSLYTFVPTIILSFLAYFLNSTVDVNYLLILIKCFSLYFIYCDKKNFDIKSVGFVFASIASMFLPISFTNYINFFGICSFSFSMIDNYKNNRMMDKSKLLNAGLLSIGGFNVFDAILLNTMINKINAYVFAGLALSIPSVQYGLEYTCELLNDSSVLHSILSIFSKFVPIIATATAPLYLMKWSDKLCKSAIMSIASGFFIITRIDFIVAIPVSLIVYGILRKIDFVHIKEILGENKNGNSYFYSIVGISTLTSFCRINDYILLKDLRKIVPFESAQVPVLFGILYLWITLFSILYGVLLHQGRKKLLISFVIISLLACNSLCALGVYGLSGNLFGIPMSYIGINLIFMFHGFFSAGDETALNTLMQDSVPSKKVYGTYFGIYDSITAIAKLLGTLVMNTIWFYCDAGTGVSVVGSYSSILLILGVAGAGLYMSNGKKRMSIEA